MFFLHHRIACQFLVGLFIAGWAGLMGPGKLAAQSVVPASPAIPLPGSPTLPSGADRSSSPVVDVAAQMRADLQYLASDELAGRSVADDSIDEAADYLARRMTQIGLDTTVIDGGPFQPVSIKLKTSAGPVERNWLAATITGHGGANQPNAAETMSFHADLNDGMTPMAIGKPAGQVTGALAFVGYGITAPEHGYDDYANVDTQGCVVIVLRKEPQANDPQSPFAGTQNTKHAFFKTKIANAIKHGAVAVILVNDSTSLKRSIDDFQQRIDRERKRRQTIEKQLSSLPQQAVNNRNKLTKRLAQIDQLVESMTRQMKQKRRGLMSMTEAGTSGKADGSETSVPIVSITRDLLDKMLRHGSGVSLDETEKRIDQTLKPQSFRIAGSKMELAIELSPTTRDSNNVLGVIDGRGSLANQTVIIGAHYDHVGMGGVGSLAPGTIAVHNGADDNASGTSVLLATAQMVKNRLTEVENHRRVVFIAFTGEERGLLGSEHYVRHPRYPLESTVGMINLDMVGRLRDNDLTVYGTGTAEGINEIVDAANERPGFKLTKVPSGYGPSDHQTFYLKKIPVLFFFTGLHNDYHRPSDDFDKINFGGMARITDIVTESAFQFAVRQQRLQYSVTENNAKIRWQKTAFVGISFSTDQDQLVISAVVPDQPADLAGIQAGDQLLQIGKRQIKQAADVGAALQGKRPGQILKFTVSRSGQTLEIPVTLGAVEY